MQLKVCITWRKVMRKFMTTLMVTAMAAFMLTGCSAKNKNTEDANTAGDTVNDVVEESTTDELDTITITHSKGVTQVPVNPEKVVVFELSVLDTMDALGVDVEVGVPSGLPSSLEKYADSTVVGSMKEADIEAIYTFEPDVIFISGRLSDYYDELNEIAPTVYVDLNAETYVDDVISTSTYIAEIFGKTEEANELIANVNESVEKAKELTTASEEKALILLTNEGSMSVYGSGSRYGFIHDVLGVKAADEGIESSTHGQEASYEYISEVNPDIIYVIDRSAAIGGTVLASETLNNDLVNSTNAAINGKIVTLDAQTWYLIGGGLNAIQSMIDEVVSVYQ